MKKPITFLRHYIDGRIITYRAQHGMGSYYDNLKQFNHQPVLSPAEVSDLIRAKLAGGEPFMVCRFGANELATLKTFDFGLKGKYAHQLSRMHTFAGLFPETDETGFRFADLMKEEIPQADLIGIWPQAFEAYYTKAYGKDTLNYTLLPSLNPWAVKEHPWSAGLKGKKVLVVHPFEESIRTQYQKKDQLCPGTEILPDFSLDVMKSVQTSGGNEDERFGSWFEAYEWMKEEILKRDFDTAILGCGAYGFPLAAEIRKAGKQAIHLGGTTQLLFGIYGSRWDNNPLIQNLRNDAWVRPLESEKPKNASSVENACYW